MRGHWHSPQLRSRRAFTLIEVTLTIAITAILLLGISGALVLTTSALGSGPGDQQQLVASEQLNLISAELATATVISGFSTNEVAFTVPDRNGDAAPETIRYTWSGTPGDPLLRSYNGGAPAICVPALQSLAPVLTLRPPAVPVEGAERVLASCDSPTLATLTTDNLVDGTHSVAQYVRPVLPAGATAYRLTKVRLFLKKDTGNAKTLAINIQSPSAALKPSGSILGGAITTSGAFPTSPAWVEFSLTSIGSGLTLTPDQAVCIVVQTVTGGSGNVASVKNGTNQPFNTHWLSAGASGVWSAPNDAEDMRFYLSGTITTLVEP